MNKNKNFQIKQEVIVIDSDNSLGNLINEEKLLQNKQIEQQSDKITKDLADQ